MKRKNYYLVKLAYTNKYAEIQKRALLYKAATKLVRIKKAFYGSALDAAYRSSAAAAEMLGRQGVHFPVKSNGPGVLSRLKDFIKSKIKRKPTNNTTTSPLSTNPYSTNTMPVNTSAPVQTSNREGFWSRLKKYVSNLRGSRQTRQSPRTVPVQQPVQTRATQEAQAAADRAVQETTASVPATTVNNNVRNVTSNTVEPPPKINKWLATSIALGMPLTAGGGYYLYNKYYGQPNGSGSNV